MEFYQAKGNTYYIEAMETIPFYKLNDKEIILLDSGWGAFDRAGLVELLAKNELRVVAIINSHAHIDHNGNNSFFKERDHAIIAMPFGEAAIASSGLMLKAYYYMVSPKLASDEFHDMLGSTDIYINDTDTEVTVCGVRFGVLQLPGHSPGHIGISTPDNVLYLGDAIIGCEEVETAKLPTVFCHAADLVSKKSLYGVKYDKYILAHKGIYEDITDLLDKNIALIEERAAAIAALIMRPMSMDEIIGTVCAQFGLRSRRPVRSGLFERDVRTFVQYLLDKGDVIWSIDGGLMKYVSTKQQFDERGNL